MVNMNGRIYSYVDNHFLSPDPNIPYPTDTRSYNRYAYARYNPMTYIDPSGFDDCITTEPMQDGGESEEGAVPLPDVICTVPLDPSTLMPPAFTGDGTFNQPPVDQLPANRCFAGGCWAASQACIGNYCQPVQWQLIPNDGDDSAASLSVSTTGFGGLVAGVGIGGGGGGGGGQSQSQSQSQENQIPEVTITSKASAQCTKYRMESLGRAVDDLAELVVMVLGLRSSWVVPKTV